MQSINLSVLLLFIGSLFQLNFSVIEATKIILHAVNGTKFDIDGINLHKTTIGQLKGLILEKEGTPIRNQRLMFDRKPLRYDSWTLADLDIYNFDDINITMMDHLEQVGVVYVETGKKIVPVFVKGSDTISYLKSLVGSISETNHKRIFFDGVELEQDSNTIADYNIYKGAHILIFNHGELFPVIIKTLSGETITLEIETTLDVGGLKHMIEEKEGTPRFEQRIVHKNTLLHDEKEVISYSDQPNEGLLLVMANPLKKGGNINIYFVPNQQTFTVYVEPNTTMDQLKDIVSKQTNVSKQNLVLEFQREQMKDEDRKLFDYKLYEGCYVKIHRSL